MRLVGCTPIFSVQFIYIRKRGAREKQIGVRAIGKHTDVGLESVRAYTLFRFKLIKHFFLICKTLDIF